MYERFRREERLIEEGAWERCNLFDVNIVPRRLSVEELERGLIGLGWRLYSREATGRRRDAFKNRNRRRPPEVGFADAPAPRARG